MPKSRTPQTRMETNEFNSDTLTVPLIMVFSFRLDFLLIVHTTIATKVKDDLIVLP